MSSRRFSALGHAIKNTKNITPVNGPKISSFFGENVFTLQKMENYLTKTAFNAVKDAVDNGKTIDRKHADKVAEGMMKWAMEKGATHFTHWFQPLRGSTAEKHDSFFQPKSDGTGIEKFNGELLVQQEPDASSFPNGGIRNTFEARGYTAWDPSSPAFIIEKAEGVTLCIPTVFVSYTGEALDYKAPLLKSVHFMQNAATEVCQLFDKNVKKTTVTLGVEQEYFLVDEDLYFSRPDLVLAGRTVVGDSPARGQQLDDHYFGSIPDRVFAYMTEFEKEAHKLGIPLMTRHNEVAPGQFECAPMFEDVNLAVDHNSLLMDIMEKVAVKHRFKVLMHEKPFKGINGSGKHNNWSIGTDTGVNLLKPGADPSNNLQFLTFFVNTIKAVYDHADLLRASIASAGNDHRLGANEAPPAIVSAFIGSTLTDVLNSFEKDKAHKEDSNSVINVNRIPDILRDNTDRNRTSPFAFTGNKFEFRAVGSDQNCASPMIVLNTIVGNQLNVFMKDVEAMKAKKKTQEEAIRTVLKGYIKKSKKILFEGNGYGEEWVKIAEKRGLSNIKTTPHALGSYVSKSSKKVFVSNGILTETELEARTEIRYENYTLKIQIEGRILNELVNAHIMPAALEYQNKLVANIKDLEAVGMKDGSVKAQKDMVKNLSKHIQGMYSANKKMTEERKVANAIEDPCEQAMAYCEKVVPYFEEIRYHADRIERSIADGDWPLPKYRELLFVR